MVFLANQSLKVFKTIIAFRHENHQSRVPPVGILSIEPNLDHTMAGDTCFGVTLKDAPKPRPQKVKRRLEIPHLGLPDFLVRNLNEPPNKRMPKIMKKTVLQIRKLTKQVPFLT